MMDHLPRYDVAVVGGGLAGLASAILLRKSGYTVVLVEKETYPFHKVCGEYISLESKPFLLSLGLPLDDWNLPLIDTLQLTAPNGTQFTTGLPLGGFGISRYKLDYELAQLARSLGVALLEGTRVDDITTAEAFTIHFNQQTISATVCLAAYGKRSNLDLRWKRPFVMQKDLRLNNFVGVKYHVLTNWPDNLIGLHNFEDGYCGISRVEEERCCVCYLTRASNLKKSGGSIAAMEEAVLYRNPHLKKVFKTADMVPGFPVTISQVSFSPKRKVESGVLMLGDAAGMITPLCGNGMSIALHTASLAASLCAAFLAGQITRQQLEKSYAQQWEHQFAARLRTGRFLQRFFGSQQLSNLFVTAFKKAPFLAKPVIRQTHGRPF